MELRFLNLQLKEKSSMKKISIAAFLLAILSIGCQQNETRVFGMGHGEHYNITRNVDESGRTTTMIITPGPGSHGTLSEIISRENTVIAIYRGED